MPDQVRHGMESGLPRSLLRDSSARDTAGRKSLTQIMLAGDGRP